MLREKAFGRWTLLSLAVAAGLGSAPRASLAQEESVEELTVTGSRIRRSDYTSPTPTTTVDGEYLRDLGLVSVGEALIHKDPPFSAGGTGGVNGIFYDTLGRSYRMGVRLPRPR